MRTAGSLLRADRSKHKPGNRSVGTRHLTFDLGIAVSPASVNPPVNQVAMNDSETFQQRIASLTAQADAFVEAGFRSLEATAQAYRELGVDPRNIPQSAGEALSLDERLQCERFVAAYIRLHLSQQPAPDRRNAADSRTGHVQMEIPAPLHTAGKRSRRSKSMARRFI